MIFESNNLAETLVCDVFHQALPSCMQTLLQCSQSWLLLRLNTLFNYNKHLNWAGQEVVNGSHGPREIRLRRSFERGRLPLWCHLCVFQEPAIRGRWWLSQCHRAKARTLVPWLLDLFSNRSTDLVCIGVWGSPFILPSFLLSFMCCFAGWTNII